LNRSLQEKPFRFAHFEANLQDLELRKRGVKVKLQEQPFQVLAILLRRSGELVTREELRQSLWPADTFVDFDHSLNTAINKIREVLGDSASNPQFVETVPKRGYRFIAKVESIGSVAEPIESAVESDTLTPESLNELPSPQRSTARFLFAAVQMMYLAIYIGALAKLDRIHDILAAMEPGSARLLQAVILLTAVLAIPARLYLLSAVSFDYRGLGVKFRRLFPALALIDVLWALSPFLMLHILGIGLAFAATAALLYVPFAQRTLIRMAYAEKTTPISTTLSGEKPMVKASWEGAVLAESDNCVVVEGNQYFPPDAVRKEYLKASQHTSECPWKGTAHYYDVVVNGRTNANAAWYYPQPFAAAMKIKDRVAFWKGVTVEVN
jgi:cholera toxin transcriptional activator